MYTTTGKLSSLMGKGFTGGAFGVRGNTYTSVNGNPPPMLCKGAQ